jgi:alkylated DNA repair dioxygenase AlkB
MDASGVLGQGSFFAEESEPAGFRYRPDFLDEAEEGTLVRLLEALPFHEVRMRGVAARRTVVHFGWDYGYESWRVTPTEPLPPGLEPWRERAAGLIGLPPAALEQVLIARYPAGAGIGWHRDAPMFGPAVVAISLLAPCVLRFRRGPGRPGPLVRVPVAPRSAYVLSGEARSAWQHSIPPVAALRYSLSFRTLRRARPAAD